MSNPCTSPVVRGSHRQSPPRWVSTARCSQPTAAIDTFERQEQCLVYTYPRIPQDEDVEVDYPMLSDVEMDALVRELGMDEDLPDLSMQSPVSTSSPTSLARLSPYVNSFSRQSSCETPYVSSPTANRFFPSYNSGADGYSSMLPASPLSTVSSTSSSSGADTTGCDSIGDLESLDSPLTRCPSIDALSAASGYAGYTSGPNTVCTSHSHRKSIKLPQRRGATQLWQFLLSLLDGDGRKGSLVEWTNRAHLEFRLLDPEAVAAEWGRIKNRPCMNYDKLSRSLRYYYDKGIMQKVPGERYVYSFTCSPSLLKNALDSRDSKRRRRRRNAPVKSDKYHNGHVSSVSQGSLSNHSTHINPHTLNGWYSTSFSYALPSCRNISVGPSENALPLLQQYAYQH